MSIHWRSRAAEYVYIDSAEQQNNAYNFYVYSVEQYNAYTLSRAAEYSHIVQQQIPRAAECRMSVHSVEQQNAHTLYNSRMPTHCTPSECPHFVQQQDACTLSTATECLYALSKAAECLYALSRAAECIYALSRAAECLYTHSVERQNASTLSRMATHCTSAEWRTAMSNQPYTLIHTCVLNQHCL